MRRYPIVAVILIALAFPAIGLGSFAHTASPSPPSRVQLVAFRGHFGGGHLGLGRRSFGASGGLLGRGRSHHLLRRIVHVLAFSYLLHLLFSHGGLSIIFWLIVIGLVVHFVRRRRRRRYAN